MSKQKVVSQANKAVAEIELSDELFGQKSKPHLVHDVVRWQLASRRSGNANTLGRSEVHGTTKKMYKQKGTGRARHGAATAPIFVGGGIVFGPKTRDYSYKLTKKVKKQALSSVLSDKKEQGKLIIIDNLNLDKIKTKQALAILDQFSFKKALLVECENENLKRSVRNVKRYKFTHPEGVNVYDLLRFEGLIMTRQAVEKLQKGSSHE